MIYEVPRLETAVVTAPHSKPEGDSGCTLLAGDQSGQSSDWLRRPDSADWTDSSDRPWHNTDL